MDLPHRRVDDRDAVDEDVAAAIRLDEIGPQPLPFAEHPLATPARRARRNRSAGSARRPVLTSPRDRPAPVPPVVRVRLTVERAGAGHRDVRCLEGVDERRSSSSARCLPSASAPPAGSLSRVPAERERGASGDRCSSTPLSSVNGARSGNGLCGTTTRPPPAARQAAIALRMAPVQSAAPSPTAPHLVISKSREGKRGGTIRPKNCRRRDPTDRRSRLSRQRPQARRAQIDEGCRNRRALRRNSRRDKRMSGQILPWAGADCIPFAAALHPKLAVMRLRCGRA